MKTHEVFNQVPAFENINLYVTDTLLSELVEKCGAGWAVPQLKAYGEKLGSPEWMEKGYLANKHTPVFHPHDRFGNRIDFIEFHQAYHDIMALAIQFKTHSLSWLENKKGAHLARLALGYLHTQNESGTSCPLTMTFACVPAIKNHFPHADEWLPKILSDKYDPANKPYNQKPGLTIGMAMTEKQGGTDVRANTSQAKPIKGKGGPGEAYVITGHKWFCSAPMCDAFLTLAQTNSGLSCFLMPRWMPDGARNPWFVQRLKDKLGNRSNASGEIEMENAIGWLIGEEGRGVSTIIEMVAMTRYDCMIGSSGLMRRGVAEAVHHCAHRKVMSELLIDQPLMLNVLADMCIESEAALAMTSRASVCLEKETDEAEQLLLRLLMPIGKYWITKRAAPLLAEAMECQGGNGYVEQSIIPRLFREAPVNAIWEGSGNVQCLDVIRAFGKSPKALDVYLAELDSATGVNSAYDKFLVDLKKGLRQLGTTPSQARRFTENMAVAMQSAQLLKMGNTVVADAFCLSRLNGNAGMLFGNLPDGINYKAIIQRFQVN